jgi:hypothetical protein
MLFAPASRITSLCPFSLRGIHAAVSKAHLTLSLDGNVLSLIN